MDEFELINIEKSLYGVKFNQSDLNLNRIEELIYQRDCIKSLSEKSFESLQTIMDRLVNMEKELRLTIGSSKSESKNNIQESIQENNQENIQENNQSQSDAKKLKDLLSVQLEHSEMFRMNTEKTLKRIKEEFSQMVLVYNIFKAGH